MRIRFAVVVPAFFITALAASPCLAQAGGSPTQQRAQELKQSVAANRQALMKYQWIQNTQVTVKGKTRKDTTNECRYGPDGKVEKTPIGTPQPQQQIPTRGVKGRVAEKKVAEMQDYTAQLKDLISHYAPPDPDMIQAAIKAGNVSVTPSSGTVTLTIVNYYQPGDKVTFVVDRTTKKLLSYDVNTYLNDQSDVVTLANQFATLPDGTNHIQQTVLDAKSKQIQMTTTNSNYTPISQ